MGAGTFSPRSNTEHYGEGQDGGDVQINKTINALENAPTIAIESRTVTDPASLSPAPMDGQSWLIPNGGIAGGSEWEGNENKVATWYSGWRYRWLVAGELTALREENLDVEVLTAGDETTAPTFRPLNAPNDFSEQDTGRKDENGNTIYRLKVNCGAGPSSTTKNVAHGISGLITTKHSHFFVRATISDGTTVTVLPFYDGTNRLIVKVDGTNIILTSNYNASGSDVLVEIEYTR